MRTAPAWFQDELTRIGGTNPYGEPIFRLAWSTTEQMVIGGKWEKSGFVGYKSAPMIPGDPCWALLVWEPAQVCAGSFEQWDRDYRDEETGLLQCGGYPKYGGYRVLQKFIHREIVRQAKERHFMVGPTVHTEVVQEKELRTYRMEPCGLMLDIMVPMLQAWLLLSNAQKVEALRQQERMRAEEYARKTKDVYEGMKLSRYMRGSQLVQKRAELIEQGLHQAMTMASQWGLGIRMEA